MQKHLGYMKQCYIVHLWFMPHNLFPLKETLLGEYVLFYQFEFQLICCFFNSSSRSILHHGGLSNLPWMSVCPLTWKASNTTSSEGILQILTPIREKDLQGKVLISFPSRKRKKHQFIFSDPKTVCSEKGKESIHTVT